MKPDAGIYDIAEVRCRLIPQETVFIDDLPQNIAAARARGWQGIVHESEHATREALTGLGLFN